MIELKLTQKIWDEADRRVAELPIFNNSHRKQAANIVGCLGEIVVEEWLKAESVKFKPELTATTHDYRLIDTSTFDVKTKDRTVAPRPDYDCSIPLYNHAHQQPDYYVFVSLQRNKSNTSKTASRYHTAWILGGMTQELLDERGKVWKKGETDPANGTKFWTDCKNVHISDLISYEELADHWWSLDF